MTTEPPEKSTPSGSPPRWRIVIAPAPITAIDSTLACHRHLMKLKLGFLRIRMAQGSPSDAHLRRASGPSRQDEFEHRPRDEDGGKHVGQEAEHQGRREAANRTGAELEQE